MVRKIQPNRQIGKIYEQTLHTKGNMNGEKKYEDSLNPIINLGNAKQDIIQHQFGLIILARLNCQTKSSIGKDIEQQ